MAKLVYPYFTLLALTLIFGLSLGSKPIHGIISAPSQIEPFVDVFKDEALKRGLDITDSQQVIIQFDATCKDNELAVSTIYLNGIDRAIVVHFDEYKWSHLTDIGKEQVVMHELGHSILKRIHNDKLSPLGNVQIPVSIMYFRHIDDLTYYRNRNYYLTELFSKRNEF